MPETEGLRFARDETVAILRRMADLIEQAGNRDGDWRWYVAYAEVRRLQARAAQLRVELERNGDGGP